LHSLDVLVTRNARAAAREAAHLFIDLSPGDAWAWGFTRASLDSPRIPADVWLREFMRTVKEEK
jgi:hypothetical protein